MSGVFLKGSPPYFFETRSLTEPVPHRLARVITEGFSCLFYPRAKTSIFQESLLPSF